MALIEECADLNITHWSAHGGQVKEAAFEGSCELLGELESIFPTVFDEPQYPITANRTPFTIELVDPALPPKRRKLYPMSSLELDKLSSQIKTLLESGQNCTVVVSLRRPCAVCREERRGGV